MALGRAQAAALGHASLPIAVIPHPFGLQSRDAVRRIAEQCAEEIARLACEAAAGSVLHAQNHGGTPPGLIEAPTDPAEFNRFFRACGWSDGLPAVPPTVERVEAMLEHARRPRDEIVAAVAPAFGGATAGIIAANAVMAGCEPEYLPVVIAAIEALADPAFNLQGIQATTNPAAPWLVINGPIAQHLGINSGVNCLGQGTWANATIGRAVRLILQNVGGALPGEMDRATHGQPGKYSFCCAENEAENPWEPLHVERGFARDCSTVTVIGASGTLNMNSHAKNAADLLQAIAQCVAFPLSNDYYFGGEPWIVLSPEHADILKRDGLGKPEIKRRLWEMSRLPAARLPAKDRARVEHIRRSELGVISADTLVPAAPSADGIGIVVAGGPGTHSVYIPTFGVTRAVTRTIAIS